MYPLQRFFQPVDLEEPEQLGEPTQPKNTDHLHTADVVAIDISDQGHEAVEGNLFFPEWISKSLKSKNLLSGMKDANFVYILKRDTISCIYQHHILI